jgi:hypothetical protein
MVTKQTRVAQYERITGLPVGASVKPDTPQEPRYHGRKGVVKAHHMGEVGVNFGTGSSVWYLPRQLVRA